MEVDPLAVVGWAEGGALTASTRRTLAMLRTVLVVTRSERGVVGDTFWCWRQFHLDPHFFSSTQLFYSNV